MNSIANVTMTLMQIAIGMCMTLLLLCSSTAADACSMYKMTVGNTTMVGNNEDSWRQDPYLSFEPGKAGTYGAVFVGYRSKSNPDGGYNEAGLVFDGFTMHRKSQLPPHIASKPDFHYGLLRTIMQQCVTVDDVHRFLNNYNLHALNGSILFPGCMLLYVDRSGRYLVVEADTMVFGNDAKFLLANFSHADTKDLNTLSMQRYRRGVAFRHNQIDTSLAFCAALADTMSVNRERIGDGTLYTTLYDLKKGLIHCYFFHSFTESRTFDLKAELAKGTHGYDFNVLFPANKGFARFVGHHTPQQSGWLWGWLAASSLLCFGTALFWGVRTVRSGNSNSHKWAAPLFTVFFGLLGYYLVVLLQHPGIFYFPAPYVEPGNKVITALSYLPFVVPAALVPAYRTTRGYISSQSRPGKAGVLLAAAVVCLAVLVVLFDYWGLYGINFGDGVPDPRP